MTSSIIKNYEGTVDTSALIWSTATDTDGKLDGSSFTKGTAATHAIQIGDATTLGTAYTLQDISFSGYNASDGQTDSALYIPKTTGSVSIYIVGGTAPSYKSDGATVDIVSNPVTTLINIKDPDGNNEAGVAVYLEGTFVDSGSHTGANNASVLTDSGQSWTTNEFVGQKVVNTTDGSAGTITANTATTITATLAGGTDNDWDTNDNYIINADLPVDEPVSITRGQGVGNAIAVVSHTAHGMNSNEYIKLSGIINDEADNSGAFQITVNTANEYQYTSNNSGNLTYTGDIRATGATIYGTTDDPGGNISSSRTYSINQPVKGYARKGTSAPYYKPIEIVDTVNSSTGLTINRRLALDQ